MQTPQWMERNDPSLEMSKPFRFIFLYVFYTYDNILKVFILISNNAFQSSKILYSAVFNTCFLCIHKFIFFIITFIKMSWKHGLSFKSPWNIWIFVFCVCFTSEIIYVTHLFYQTWTTKLRGGQCTHDEAALHYLL